MTMTQEQDNIEQTNLSTFYKGRRVRHAAIGDEGIVTGTIEVNGEKLIQVQFNDNEEDVGEYRLDKVHHYLIPLNEARTLEAATQLRPPPFEDVGGAAPTEAHAPELTFADRVDAVLSEIRALLLSKNAAYGNSALDPVRIFSQASPVEQLKVRIDDKLSRVKRGSAAGEDVTLDTIGYLVMFRIATKDGEAA